MFVDPCVDGEAQFFVCFDGVGAFVPVQTRSERFTSTNVDDFDAVTGREQSWKLTPVARVAELGDE